MSTITTTTVSTTETHLQGTSSSRLTIRRDQYPGLDPEWIDLWNIHGAHMVRADELSIEDYRKNPAAYGFTYPTCSGKIFLHAKVSFCNDSLRYVGPDVFHVGDKQVLVTTPVGEITVRVYSPEGPGPFPVHLNFHGGKSTNEIVLSARDLLSHV